MNTLALLPYKYREHSAQLSRREGDCCVYCSFGTVPCPPIQENTSCC
ncbi:MAG: GDCCVxC domain-containing (seleno)protein [Flavobacteriales bacterium]